MSHGNVTDLRSAQRVLCFGATGSGKSTTAELLGRRMGLPVTLVDELCWLPGWQQRPPAEQQELIGRRIDEPRWVLDSVYRAQAAHALARADVMVALDYPRLLSLWRLLRRTVRRIRTRERVCNGNVETWRRTVGRDSILWWHVRSWRSKRQRIRTWYADPDALPVILLSHPRDLDRLLAEL